MQCGNCLLPIAENEDYVRSFGEYYHAGDCLLESEARMPSADELWDNPFSGFEGE